jgi:hypothetical protein
LEALGKKIRLNMAHICRESEYECGPGTTTVVPEYDVLRVWVSEPCSFAVMVPITIDGHGEAASPFSNRKDSVNLPVPRH